MPSFQFIDYSKDEPKSSKVVDLNDIESKEDLIDIVKETRKEEITFVDVLTGKPVKKINVELGK
jgi:hypothetical protein